MAVRRKSDRRRVYLCAGGHRNYVSHPEPAKWGVRLARSRRHLVRLQKSPAAVPRFAFAARLATTRIG